MGETLGAWASAVDSLSRVLKPQAIKDWIDPLQVISEEVNRLTLRVPSQYHRDWFETNYLPLVLDHLRAQTASHYEVCFEVDEADHVAVDHTAGISSIAGETIPTYVASVSAPATVAREKRPQWLSPRYTFDQFVPGPSNHSAYSACVGVAGRPASAYNPLLIYGDSGLGKTHLLHAVAHQILVDHPEWNVLYVSCERFVNEYIHSLRSPDRAEGFRRRFREEPDVLLVDDVQFLSGKDSTQQEFFHTFNALHESHKQIVLTSDRPPHEISDIPERLRSRFSWGLIVEINPPDLETRIAIIKNKAELNHIVLPDDVAEQLATTFKRNVRELESALIRLIFFASLDGGRTISRDLAESKLPELAKSALARITVDEVLRHVAEYYGCKVTDLRGPKRTSHITKPRAVAMYLAAKLTGCSLPEIGRGFGGKHHTTVLAAREKICKQMESDRGLQQEVDLLSRRIQG